MITRRLPGKKLSLALAFMAIVMLGVLAMPRAARATEPRVERYMWSDLLEQIQANEDEELILGFVFDDYHAALTKLADSADAAAEAAGRQRVDDALAGRVFLDPQELRELRVAVQQAEASTWPEADALMASLLEDAQSVVPRDEAIWQAALRELRRVVYLRTQQSDDRDETYAGQGVDVLELVRAAQVPGGELEALERRELDVALGTYAVQVDAYIVRYAAAERRGRHELALARMKRDDAARRHAESEALQRWQEFYRLNERVVEQVATALEQNVSGRAAARWRQRFEEACFPWLYRRSRANQIHAWIIGRRLDEGVGAQATVIHDEYVAGRVRLLRAAVDLVRRARLDHGVVLSSRMGADALRDGSVRELYQEFLKNSGERQQVEDDAVEALEALLTSGQRDQMRADLAAAVHGRRR